VKANTEVFASQATVQAVLLIKQEALTTARGRFLAPSFVVPL
jgi:hypothetical protein